MFEQYYNSDLSLPEIFEKVRKFEGSNDEKAQLLFKYDSHSLRWFVDVMYNAPLGGIDIPVYEPSKNPVGNNYMTIRASMGKLEHVIGDKTNANNSKMLKNILQNVHADEAQLIVNLLKGEKIDGISKAVFKKTYPQFFPVTGEETLFDLQGDD